MNCEHLDNFDSLTAKCLSWFNFNKSGSMLPMSRLTLLWRRGSELTIVLFQACLVVISLFAFYIVHSITNP